MTTTSIVRCGPRGAGRVRSMRATEALLKDQQPDGHWVFELEADATIPR